MWAKKCCILAGTALGTSSITIFDSWHSLLVFALLSLFLCRSNIGEQSLLRFSGIDADFFWRPKTRISGRTSWILTKQIETSTMREHTLYKLSLKAANLTISALMTFTSSRVDLWFRMSLQSSQHVFNIPTEGCPCAGSVKSRTFSPRVRTLYGRGKLRCSVLGIFGVRRGGWDDSTINATRALWFAFKQR